MASLALSIGLIASLNRAEESIRAKLAVGIYNRLQRLQTVCPLIPAIKVRVCVPPMRIVSVSPATPGSRISIFTCPWSDYRRRNPHGDVNAAGSVVKERSTVGRVVVAGGVA